MKWNAHLRVNSIWCAKVVFIPFVFLNCNQWIGEKPCLHRNANTPNSKCYFHGMAYRDGFHLEMVSRRLSVLPTSLTVINWLLNRFISDVWNSGHSMVIFHNVRAKHFHLLDFLLSDSGPNNNFPNLSDFHSDEMKTSDGCWAINRIRLIRFSVIWFWVKWK